MYTLAEVDYIERNLKESGRRLWIPNGDDGDIVKRSLSSGLSHAMSLVKLFDVTSLASDAQETPLIFVATGAATPNAYATSPAAGRPLICVDMELAIGFSDLLKATLTQGSLSKDSSANRYVFSLTWGLRWLLFHEIAHLGFGHLSERPETIWSEVSSSNGGVGAPPYSDILESRCQEAEADLWATHMSLRDVASQFYQILVDEETSYGRPFSHHLFSSMITLFSYLNSEALAHKAYAELVHPHPAVRATLVHWYARKACGSMEFFVVDWHHSNIQLEMLAEAFRFNKLPNLMLSKDDQTGNVQSDLDLTLVRLRERQTGQILRRRLFRLDL